MPTQRPPYQVHLFILRLWQEALDGEQLEWRGEVKNTSTGEIRYFRDWHALPHLLRLLLAEPTEYQSQNEPDAID